MSTPRITKIALTGGACGGKSSAINYLQDYFSARGVTVVIVSETATDLIASGISPDTCGVFSFEKAILQSQIDREDHHFEAAQDIDNDHILLICDRGALDCRAYMPLEDWQKLLAELNLSEEVLRDRYDAVFHLVTTAKGAEEFYTLENNPSRSEPAKVAAQQDNDLIAVYTGHPHLRIIDNSTDFDGKMQRLFSEVAALLGIPAPLEIERRFLIERPDWQWLKTHPFCHKSQITQIYLEAGPMSEERIRQRGSNGHYTYTHCTKSRKSALERYEQEQRISAEEYIAYLDRADPHLHPIHKERYCLVHNGYYLEIDRYKTLTGSRDYAILEIELSSPDASLPKFPPELKIIREITDDRRFDNHSLAKDITVLDKH